MPVVRLSDAAFADLRTLAAWLGTDTPSQTIDAVISQTMTKLDLERDVEGPAGFNSDSGLLEFENTPGLAFTRVLNATVDGEPLTKANWSSLLVSVIAAVKNLGHSPDEMVKILDIPAKRSPQNDQGYTYYPELSISIQGQSAQDAWKECERLAKKFLLSIEVQFQWRDNAKAQHPGRQGVLRVAPSGL